MIVKLRLGQSEKVNFIYDISIQINNIVRIIYFFYPFFLSLKKKLTLCILCI